MEGRLVPPEPGRFQAFPKDRWSDEFELAASVPLSYIEWIYDDHGADVNPLIKNAVAMMDLMSTTGVSVRSLCADYFMDFPFLRCSELECNTRRQTLNVLIERSQKVGINRIVLPFVDASKIESREDQDVVIEVINEAIERARQAKVELHLETDLGPREFAGFLGRLPDPLVKVNYDSGNSSSLGYKPADEFAAYGERIGSIHIKDRVRGGGTVPLGTGNADFVALFEAMRSVGYSGDITLQVARSHPGEELSWARINREFVSRYWHLE